MRFAQLDRITSLEPGVSITAVKSLCLSEEYLQDHFPRFPVMPGVLMLESLFQASTWLVRATHRFEHSTTVLRESKNIKFQDFVQPGDQLKVVCEIKPKKDGDESPLTTLKVSGTVNGKVAVSGRLVLDSYNLADREEADPAIDKYMTHKFKLTFRQLCNQLDRSNLLEMLAQTASTS